MATKYGAYAGRVVKINLTDKTVTEYPYSDKDRELYLGGKGMAAKIIYDNITKPIDPLSEDNMLVISTGPLNGMGSPCSSRFNVSTISPLTNLYTSSNCGGRFGMSLKMCGFDAIIIVGKAEEKTYLDISDQKIEFKNADHLWGLNTTEAQQKMEGKGGKFVIGPAGENKVLYACVISDDRAAGRGGVGAVFGSKNLKGIHAMGVKIPDAFDREKLNNINKNWTKRLQAHPTTGVQLPKLGTAGLVVPMHAKNLLATKNYSSGKFEHFEEISGETLKDKHLISNKGCITCPIRCARVVNVEEKHVKGPEVETIGLFGSNILNKDLQKIFDWNYEMDELGLDTISCGNTIAYAMEANEKKLWDNGLEFGKIDNISQIIEDIAHRRGVGNELADGSRKLAEKYGGVEFAMNVKGMEIAAYEPRGAVGQGLGYAVSNRGGCHLNGGYMVVMEGLGLAIDPYTTNAKAGMTALFQNLMEACSLGGNCLFTTYAFFPIFIMKNANSIVTRIINKLATYFGLPIKFILRFPSLLAINMPAMMLPHPMAITAATGMKYNFGKFIRTGERAYNLERLIDVKLGVSAKDDTLPSRLTKELQLMNNKNSKVPIDKLRKQYYKLRGWDENGAPTKKLLKRLKIES